MFDSFWFWIGLVIVFVGVLIPIGLHNSESAFLQRAEEYGVLLESINEKGLIFKEQGKQQEFEEQAILMQQNLEVIARDALNLNIKPWPEYSIYFPLRYASDWEPIPGTDAEICEIGPNIAFHLYEISKTERFQLFAKKYSKYPMNLDVMDERRYLSAMHYGFSVGSSDGKFASTHFHVNTCTNQISDESRYFVHCSDETTEYRNSAITKEDYMASLEHDEFCIVPLDPWRQSLFDYSQKISQKRHQIMDGFEELEKTDEVIMQFHRDMQRWDLLQDIVNAHYTNNTEKAEEKTKQYIRAHDELPQELRDIIKRKSQ